MFITHGDVLHPAISPWAPHARRLQELHEDMIASLDSSSEQNVQARLEAAQYAAHFEWDQITREPEPEQSWFRRRLNIVATIARVLWYWHSLPGRASEFANRYAPESRFFIFGHIHRSGIWHYNGRVLVNTGSFHCPHNPHAVVVENKRLTVWPVRNAEGLFDFAPKPLAQLPLRYAVAA